MPGVNDGIGPISKIWLILLGGVIAAAGAFFVIGGARLISLGGSFYFLLAGLALVASGLLIAIRRPLGALVFGGVFLITVLWSLWEVGFTFWPLISRLLAMAVGSTVVAFSYPLLRRAQGQTTATRPALAVGGALALASVAGLAGMFVPHAPVAFAGAVSPLTPVASGQEQKNWEAYGNTAGGSRFVALDQITRDNVKGLKVAWTYPPATSPRATATAPRTRPRHCRSATPSVSARPTTTSSPWTPTAAARSGRPWSTPRLRSGCGAAAWPISTPRRRCSNRTCRTPRPSPPPSCLKARRANAGC